jgi:hypothetical protein
VYSRKRKYRPVPGELRCGGLEPDLDGAPPPFPRKVRVSQCQRGYRCALSPVTLGSSGTVDPGPWRREGHVFRRFFDFDRVCDLLKNVRRWQLTKDGIRFSRPSPYSSGVSSIVGGHLEVCLRWMSLFGLLRCNRTSRPDPSDVRYSSLAAVVVLVRWSYGP